LSEEKHMGWLDHQLTVSGFHCHFGLHSIVSFRLNGGDDGARTRDLCRDSYAN